MYRVVAKFEILPSAIEVLHIEFLVYDFLSIYISRLNLFLWEIRIETMFFYSCTLFQF